MDSVDPSYGTSSTMTQAARPKAEPNRLAAARRLIGNKRFKVLYIKSLPDDDAKERKEALRRRCLNMTFCEFLNRLVD